MGDFMVVDIVNLLHTVVVRCMNMTSILFNTTGTFSFYLGGLSILLITKFILGPLLGFTLSGSSDVAHHNSVSGYLGRKRSDAKKVASFLSK